MKTYDIKKVYCATPDWSKIDTLSIDVPYHQTPDDITACAQICYTDDALLVHLSTVEKDIRAVENGPLGMPCEDSCLEFFFCPMPYEKDKRYFNIEFNSNGCMFLGVAKDYDNILRVLLYEKEGLFNEKINITSDGWEIFYSVPFSFIRHFFPEFEAYEGLTIRANCYKCADYSNPPHYLSWNKIESERLSYHQSQFFGSMTFVK